MPIKESIVVKSESKAKVQQHPICDTAPVNARAWTPCSFLPFPFFFLGSYQLRAKLHFRNSFKTEY